MNLTSASAIRCGLLLVIVAWLSACSASSRPSGQVAAAGSTEPWFCETGANSESWDCIQSEALARAPEPTRSPPRRAKPEPAPIPATPIPATPIPAAPSRQPIAAPTATAVAPGSTPVPAESARVDEEDLPKHVRLAYRPDAAVPMMDVPGEYWAVQLIALSSKEALEDFAREHNVKGMPAARIAAEEKVFYVLLLGIYETRAIATEASTELPAPFNNAWIRSVASLQRAMLAADELTGTTMQ